MANTLTGKLSRDINEGDRVYRKVTWRLAPLLFACYVVAYIDRVNVGFAKLQMLGNLHFSSAAYGLGAGMFSSPISSSKCRAT